MAVKGVLGDLNPLVDGSYRSLANNGARVPKKLPAAELEGFIRRERERDVRSVTAPRFG